MEGKLKQKTICPFAKSQKLSKSLSLFLYFHLPNQNLRTLLTRQEISCQRTLSRVTQYATCYALLKVMNQKSNWTIFSFLNTNTIISKWQSQYQSININTFSWSEILLDHPQPAVHFHSFSSQNLWSKDWEDISTNVSFTLNLHYVSVLTTTVWSIVFFCILQAFVRCMRSI